MMRKRSEAAGSAGSIGTVLLLALVAGCADAPPPTRYAIAPAHLPVTADHGCEHVHIHSDHALGPNLIHVTHPETAGWLIADPKPSHCGHGPRIDVPWP